MARKVSYSAKFSPIDGGFVKECFDYRNDTYKKYVKEKDKELTLVAEGKISDFDKPKNKTFFVYDTKPRFNQGLGCVTEGTRHAEQIAKSRGLEPIGDAPLKTVAKQYWPDHPMTKGL